MACAVCLIGEILKKLYIYLKEYAFIFVDTYIYIYTLNINFNEVLQGKYINKMRIATVLIKICTYVFTLERTILIYLDLFNR